MPASHTSAFVQVSLGAKRDHAVGSTTGMGSLQGNQTAPGTHQNVALHRITLLLICMHQAPVSGTANASGAHTARGALQLQTEQTENTLSCNACILKISLCLLHLLNSAVTMLISQR